MNKLKRLRAERGLTLRKLAIKADLNQSTISLIETDKRKAQLVTLGKLAKALEVSLDDLLEFMDDSAPERGRKGGAARHKKEDQADETQTDDPMSHLTIVGVA